MLMQENFEDMDYKDSTRTKLSDSSNVASAGSRSARSA